MSATTTISAIELEQMPMPIEPAPAKQDIKQPNVRPDAASGSSCLVGANGGSEPCPHPAVPAAERWNESRTHVYRMAACFFSFLVMGANDSAYGPLLPYLEKYYNLTYIVVSLVFLSPFVGYVCSAILNNYLHHRVGQRGIAVICGACHAAAYTIIALHPPYIVLVFAFILAGFGNGVADAAWNAWVGNLANSSEVLGLLHACYGVGGAVSPTIATTLITKANLGWYSFYYIMIGMAGVEMVVLASAFWSSSGAEYRRIHSSESNRMGLSEALFCTPSARVTWVTAAFLLCYVGVEVALGGWIVIFMIRVRHGEAFASGMSAVGFWLGITAGRAVLGFVTPRVGVKLSTALYIVAAGALELIFWLVPQFYVSVVAVAFQGFFLGPMFPNAVLVAQKLLPRQHHVVVIGFAAAFGGCGAAVLPFLTGILAQAKGPMVLQPIVLALLAVMLGIWLCFPRVETKRE